MMLSLTDINARLASIRTRITHMEMNVDKIYTYLETFTTHTISPWFIHLSKLREVLENIKKRNSIAPLFGSTKLPR